MLQARVGSRSIDIDPTPGAVTVDGEPRDVRIERLDEHTVLLVLDGVPHTVTLVPQDDGTTLATIGGTAIPVEIKSETDLLLERFGMEASDGAADREVRAPMPGLVLRVSVAPGDAVEAGQGVAVLEAMKMENELKAPSAGTVAAVHAAEGDAVAKNALLIELA